MLKWIYVPSYRFWFCPPWFDSKVKNRPWPILLEGVKDPVSDPLSVPFAVPWWWVSAWVWERCPAPDLTLGLRVVPSPWPHSGSESGARHQTSLPTHSSQWWNLNSGKEQEEAWASNCNLSLPSTCTCQRRYMKHQSVWTTLSHDIPVNSVLDSDVKSIRRPGPEIQISDSGKWRHLEICP